jgi:hypothetical protein
VGEVAYTRKAVYVSDFSLVPTAAFWAWFLLQGEAFAAGEWDTALSLIEEKRDVYTRKFREAARLNVLEQRLRVVEFPVTRYVTDVSCVTCPR